MEMSPQTVRSTGFKLVKKGYDPDEVDAFKEQVAGAVEFSQNQATAMEARARAAVAKLQEVSQQVSSAPREAAPAAPAPSGDTEVISRTLLLAQRTADAAVAEARTEAEQLVAQARDEAGRVLDSARTMATKTIDDARAEARRSGEDERVRADNEVQSLLARRDFLLSDVDHLEQYLQAQRERLRDAAVQLHELVDRVPGGLGEMRRPLLSASAEPLPPSLAPTPPPPPPTGEPAVDPLAEFADLAADPAPAAANEPAPAAERSTDLNAMALSSNPDTKDSVWRLLDEEVAQSNQAQSNQAQASFDDLVDTTDEVGRAAAPVDDDPFAIGGEELQ